MSAPASTIVSEDSSVYYSLRSRCFEGEEGRREARARARGGVYSFADHLTMLRPRLTMLGHRLTMLRPRLRLQRRWTKLRSRLGSAG